MRTMLTALGSRRDSLKNEEGQKGFTLIELLVVVIIIGILAAIAIPVYLGIQDGAKNSAVQADLTNAKVAVVAAQTLGNGALPADQAALVTSGYVLPDAGNYTTPIAYKKGTGASFCISGQSKSGKWFQITDTTAAKEATGACA